MAHKRTASMTSSERSEDGIVNLKIRKIRFLVECSLLETERVDDVVDGLCTFFHRLLLLFGRRIGTCTSEDYFSVHTLSAEAGEYQYRRRHPLL